MAWHDAGDVHAVFVQDASAQLQLERGLTVGRQPPRDIERPGSHAEIGWAGGERELVQPIGVG